MAERTEMDRRKAIQSLGAIALAPVLPLTGHHPLVPPQEPNAPWSPSFLSEDEHRTVFVLVELIIPETDTPGAQAARVDQYIDFVLSQDVEAGRRFQEGLRRLDQLAVQRYPRAESPQSPFADLSAVNQTALLTSLSTDDAPDSDRRGSEFFKDIKERTIVGYYTSEVGMLEELGFEGNDFLTEFKGCTHTEHLKREPK